MIASNLDVGLRIAGALTLSEAFLRGEVAPEEAARAGLDMWLSSETFCTLMIEMMKARQSAETDALIAEAANSPQALRTRAAEEALHVVT